MNRLFEISRRSLSTYQAALNVTSHNISNANNQFYSRQKVSVIAQPLEGVGTRFQGSGSQIGSIERIKDTILVQNLQMNNYGKSYADKMKDNLSRAELYFTEPGELGLSSRMGAFFNSWKELSVNPASTSARQSVVSSSESLISKFSEINEGLFLQKKDTVLEAKGLASDINAKLNQIRTLNEQIYTTEGNGGNASDLMDSRDEVINNLSKLVNITVYNDERNISNISIGGVFAVDISFVTEFEVVEQGNQLIYRSKDDGSVPSVKGGSLGATLETFNTKLPNYKQQIDDIAKSIYDNVNALHSTGYTLTDPPSTSIDFFTNYGEGIFKLNDQIKEDVRMIAASGNGQAGNNTISASISSLRDQKILNNSTLEEVYGTIMGELAGEISVQEQDSETFELAINQLESRITEKSGVSLDEEMVNIINFQRSYEASARLIKIADEMLQTILGMIQ